jgi:hypothetical protein
MNFHFLFFVNERGNKSSDIKVLSNKSLDSSCYLNNKTNSIIRLKGLHKIFILLIKQIINRALPETYIKAFHFMARRLKTMQ